jgi:hypothetical protein
MNLLALNQNHEPESAEEALKIYAKILLPERNVDETIKRLTPLLNDPELIKKVDQAAGQTQSAKSAMQEDNNDMMMNDQDNKKQKDKPSKKLNPKKGDAQVQLLPGNNTMLAQVAGIIIGSPEFQRR